MFFYLFALVSLAGSSSGLADSDKRVLTMYCNGQYYRKWPPGAPKEGVWLTDPGPQISVILSKDPNYPNPSEPRTIWIGHDNESYSGAVIKVDFQVFELSNQITGYSNSISISRDGITAESEGGTFLRAAFRTKDGGVGIICHDMAVK